MNPVEAQHPSPGGPPPGAGAGVADAQPGAGLSWPSVTIVFLAYNRRQALRESLRRMLTESDYPSDRVDVVVVDNASTDGSAEMVRTEFPGAQLIVREQNTGVSAVNAGFAVARGDYVLALDDDCYLPSDGLRRAVGAARDWAADLVSFKVVNPEDPTYVYNEKYRTGLFLYWGCAVLLGRRVLEELGGYDPEIFIWANELEFTIRCYDAGFRHLHFPQVAAQHMKPLPPEDGGWDAALERSYRLNSRHFAYIAAKLLRPREAAEAIGALVARNVRDGLRDHPGALKALPDTVAGFAAGLRSRRPVRNGELSRFYRRNFHSFASPWSFARPPGELVRALPREALRGRPPRNQRERLGRHDRYLEARAHLYPSEPAVLQF